MAFIRPVIRDVWRPVIGELADKYGTGVPFKSDLDGWYKPVDGNDFLESINDNDAKFLPRVADFNGTDNVIIFDNAVVPDIVTLKIKYNDGTWKTVTDPVAGLSTVVGLWDIGGTALAIGTDSLANLFTGMIAWVEGYDVGSVLIFSSHLKGSGGYEYDIKGTAYGTWFGTGAMFDYDLEGSTQYATGGYSLWQLLGSDDIQVPFDLTGSAIALTAGVDIPAGYTKTRDLSGSISTWNMADCLVDFNPTATLLERNADIVWSGGYETISEIPTINNLQYINKNNVSICRVTGTLTKIKMYIVDLNFSVFLFTVWRDNGVTYDEIYSEDLVSKLVASGTVEITLGAGCDVQAGDYIGLNTTNGITAVSIAGVDITTAASSRYINNPVPVSSPHDWDSETALTYTIPIHLFAQAPMVAAIGDSIMAGYNINRAGVSNAVDLNEQAKSMPGKLYTLDNNYIYQNMAIGGTTSTWVEANFDKYVVALKPKIAIINSGVNDIFGGVITKSTYLSNYTSILDKCVANGIVPVVCKILPWTNGTNGQMQTRDDWMTDLEALVATYSDSVWVDFDVAMGKFRVGGDVGNLWDLKDAINDDGVHVNEDGNEIGALVIDPEIKKEYTF